MNTLNKSQLINLLCNAYGFVDKHGVLFTTHDLAHNEFELISANQDLVRFDYENAKLVNGTVTFETIDGDTESFTVVVVAVDALADFQSLTVKLPS
jgi:hypothetical protein